MQEAPVLSLSPSFNSYSDPKIAGIAAEVCSDRAISSDRDPESDDCDFDFAFVTRDSESSSQIPADEIFQDGKIRPVYPVKSRNSDSERPKTRHSLGKLFIEERETTMATSTSSSEADETEPATATEERRWEKSPSAGGNSRRWNLKSLMKRSQSEGSKDSVVILAHSAASARKKEDERKARETPVTGGKVRPPPPTSNRDGSEKLRSYLPYRLDLVGFFGNVNGMRKNSKQY